MSGFGPKRSLDATARHLLRHLNNGKELRRNPIASAFFEPPSAIFLRMSDAEIANRMRREINLILSDLKRRSRSRSDDPGLMRAIQIVERCVLAREPWQTVAYGLGISKRQYARDKARIAAMIMRLLLERSATQLGMQAHCVMTAALNACMSSAERGGESAALSRLYEMTGDSNDLLSRIATLSSAAQIAVACGRLSEAGECVRRLNELLAFEAEDSPSRRYADAVLDLMQGECAYDEGSCERGISLIRRSINNLRVSATEGVPDANLRLVRALTVLGEALGDQGFFAQAEEPVAEGLRYLSAAPNVSSVFEAQALNVFAQLLMAQEQHSRRLDDYIARAQALAIKEGLLNQLAWALIHRAQLAAHNGQPLVASQWARECLETAANNASAAGKAVAAVALLFSATKNPSEPTLSSMVELLRGAVAAMAPACGNWVFANVQLANLELSRNRADVAKAFAQIADDTAAAVRPPFERARTLECLAEVEAKLGNEDRAKNLIFACIDLAEKYERPRWLAHHYAAAAKLTGDPRFSRNISAAPVNASSARDNAGAFSA